MTEGDVTDVEDQEEDQEEEEPAPAPADFSNADQGMIDDAAQFVAEQNAALLSGATADATDGPNNTEDVDAAGLSLIFHKVTVRKKKMEIDFR